jgi:hypothetical protein
MDKLSKLVTIGALALGASALTPDTAQAQQPAQVCVKTTDASWVQTLRNFISTNSVRDCAEPYRNVGLRVIHQKASGGADTVNITHSFDTHRFIYRDGDRFVFQGNPGTKVSGRSDEHPMSTRVLADEVITAQELGKRNYTGVNAVFGKAIRGDDCITFNIPFVYQPPRQRRQSPAPAETTVKVVMGPPETNLPPTVQIVTPVKNAEFLTDSVYNLVPEVKAQDDKNVQTLTLRGFRDTTEVFNRTYRTGTEAPQREVRKIDLPQRLGLGSYTMIAQTTDDQGLVAADTAHFTIRKPQAAVAYEPSAVFRFGVGLLAYGGETRTGRDFQNSFPLDGEAQLAVITQGTIPVTRNKKIVGYGDFTYVGSQINATETGHNGPAPVKDLKTGQFQNVKIDYTHFLTNMLGVRVGAENTGLHLEEVAVKNGVEPPFASNNPAVRQTNFTAGAVVGKPYLNAAASFVRQDRTYDITDHINGFKVEGQFNGDFRSNRIPGRVHATYANGVTPLTREHPGQPGSMETTRITVDASTTPLTYLDRSRATGKFRDALLVGVLHYNNVDTHGARIQTGHTTPYVAAQLRWNDVFGKK